ncbi:MAG: NIPSNAP family protein [Gemmataceae bacterium]
MRCGTRLWVTLAMLLGSTANAADKDARLYELRVYYAAPGKLDALHARFRDHTLKLFERHGMTNIGYWVPESNPDNRLVYLLAHKDRDSATASWKAFIADADWQKAYKASETNGKLAAKADAFFLTATDFSPSLAAAKPGTDRVFELRTYVTPAKGLDAIQARFRDHTIKLFEKHGMTNLAYWSLAKDDKATLGKLLTDVAPAGQEKFEGDAKLPAGPVTLVYLLAHDSVEKRTKSFDAFRADPDWTKARTASEAKAGGSLTLKDGVKSLILKATDYSPMK